LLGSGKPRFPSFVAYKKLIAPAVPRLFTFLILLVLAGCERPTLKEETSPLTREAYVWQQTSTPALDEAVRIALPELESLSFHAADIRFQRSIADVQKFPVPWSILKKSGKPVSLVIRIYADLLQPSIEQIDPLRDLVHELLGAVREVGLDCREIQLDYDCPDSQVALYAKFIRDLQRAVPEVRLPITALPSWLKSPDFPELAASAGEYILQVHSLSLPKPNEKSITLFDPTAAWKAVDRATQVGLPFRLALPTYRCTVVMDARGKRGSAYSENSPPSLENGQHYLSGTAEPDELAAFVSQIQSNRPPLLTGLIWYRLPVSTDRMNWPWFTFQLVSQGIPPKSQWETKLDLRPEGFSTITIHNVGQQPELAPARVIASWPPNAFIAADALGGYVLNQADAHTYFTPLLILPPIVLQPGDKLTIGWIRLTPGEAAKISLE